MLIFSGSSNKNLAQKLANKLGFKLGDLEIHTFPDNENRVRVIDNVVDQDVLVVQSAGVLPNLYYMELFFILDSLKRSGARSLTLVIPYLGYQRQDHVFRSGEAVSLEVIINIIESLGVSKVISFDLHSVKIPQLFSVQIKHLSALPLFAEKIKKLSGTLGTRGTFNDLVLVTPDMGGIARIKKLSKLLGNAPFVTVEKNRDLVTGDIDSMKFSGKVGKIAVIVDDVISTGKTIVSAGNLLSENGAEKIYVMATHGIFAGNASYDLQEIESIKKVIVTDTIDIPDERKFEKLEIISVADLIANELKNN